MFLILSPLLVETLSLSWKKMKSCFDKKAVLHTFLPGEKSFGVVSYTCICSYYTFFGILCGQG